MRRLIASVLSAALLFSATPLYAARPGSISGNAKDAEGQNLPNHIVRARDVSTGGLAGVTTSSATGQFSFPGLPPGTYVIEIVKQSGEIIGISSVVSVTDGATAAVTVNATAAAAEDQELGRGGAYLTSMAGLITVAAAGAGVGGILIATNRDVASPSR